MSPSKRQRHDTRSDGRVELMERQRTEFESAPEDEAHLFAEIETNGTKAETRHKVTELLQERGLLDAEDSLLHG